MNNTIPGPQISSVAELLAHAYHMELEAEERYRYLAEQMEVHNNTDLASLFRKLAEVEGIHAKDILQQMQKMNVSQLASSGDTWAGNEPPESIDMGEAFYLMTPREALQLAAHCDAMVPDTGAVFVHPFDDPLVIAGQGTIGDEIVRQSHDPPHAVFVPVGGGGLIAGIATYVKTVMPAVT